MGLSRPLPCTCPPSSRAAGLADALATGGWPNCCSTLALLAASAAARERERPRVGEPDAAAVPELAITGNTLELSFPPDWLAEHPMTATDLEYEQSFLAAAAVGLTAR